MDYDLTTIRGLLAELRENGSKVRLGDVDDLQVQGDLGPELLERLREHKSAVLSYLKNPPTWPCQECGKHLFPTPGVTCFWCRQKERAGLQPAPPRGHESPHQLLTSKIKEAL